MVSAPGATSEGPQGTDDDKRSRRARLFVDARAAMPAAGRIAARLERQDQRLRLRVPAAALPPEPTSVRFFAGHWGLIEHAAPQSWELQDGQLEMDLASGAAADATPPTGLLVVDARNGTRALQIDATANVLSGTPSGGSEPTSEQTLALQGQRSVPARVAAEPLGLPVALVFALVGGLVLNLMPCVFPVLAIKALALAQQGETALRQRALHGAAYTTGVLALFGGIALVLLALRAGGAALGWGFQLQSPAFVVLMGYLFLTLGLSLSGAVTLGIGLTRVGASSPQHGHLGAFATGALAALVAAPCTAPFMGAAVGYAVAQPWPVALTVILTLGLGMALPLATLMLSPALARQLPRPGPWMEHLKQFLAFPMFATAAWLLWVLSQQAGSAGVGAALAGAVLLALGLWLLELTRAWAVRWRWFGRGGFAASLAAALWLAVGLAAIEGGASNRAVTVENPQQAGLAAEPFSAKRLGAARAAERPVFVNMTAAWCITCLVNERVALTRPAVVSAFTERDMLYLKGDWTNRDAAITEYLAGYGRNGVPLYVYYPARGEPRVLPQVLSESVVLDALQQ
jgi:thiol:disulfide interchange protein DsbD